MESRRSRAPPPPSLVFLFRTDRQLVDDGILYHKYHMYYAPHSFVFYNKLSWRVRLSRLFSHLLTPFLACVGMLADRCVCNIFVRSSIHTTSPKATLQDVPHCLCFNVRQATTLTPFGAAIAVCLLVAAWFWCFYAHPPCGITGLCDTGVLAVIRINIRARNVCVVKLLDYTHFCTHMIDPCAFHVPHYLITSGEFCNEWPYNI